MLKCLVVNVKGLISVEGHPETVCAAVAIRTLVANAESVVLDRSARLIDVGEHFLFFFPHNLYRAQF